MKLFYLLEFLFLFFCPFHFGYLFQSASSLVRALLVLVISSTSFTGIIFQTFFTNTGSWRFFEGEAAWTAGLPHFLTCATEWLPSKCTDTLTFKSLNPKLFQIKPKLKLERRFENVQVGHVGILKIFIDGQYIHLIVIYNIR